MTTATKATPLDQPAATATAAVDGLADRARGAASSLNDVATDLGARLPDAATEVDRMIRSGSDDTLRLASVATVGFAVGMLAGGANRLLILASLVPAGLMAIALSGRKSL